MSKFDGYKLEFHILQSFPVSCLNRDDMNQAKTAIIGGTKRARISSQCFKRAIRMKMHEFGIELSNRTKFINKLLEKELVNYGATEEQVNTCSKQFSDTIKNESTLMFFTNSEVKKIAELFKNNNFKLFNYNKNNKKNKKDDIEIIEEETTNKKNKKCSFESSAFRSMVKSVINNIVGYDGVDVALFGRMVAQCPTFNISAASSFSHAISINEVKSELDFFTAGDDCKSEFEPDSNGAAHLDSNEFNSATYYRYISVDLGQLVKNLDTEEISDVVKTFIQALFVAVPCARQNSMAAYSPWDFAIVTIRKGQNIQMSFEKAVRKTNDLSIAEVGIKELKEKFESMKSFYGSIFGEKFTMELEPNKNSFDNLIDNVTNEINKIM